MQQNHPPDRISDVATVEVPSACVAEVFRHVRNVGLKGFEGVALWAGTQHGTLFRVVETVIPRQEGIRSPQGLAYVVGSDELHRINVSVYERKLQLIAQLHSHPTEAYHSDTDDAYPIITVQGGFSLVIPYFGQIWPTLNNCAVYRLTANVGWRELSRGEVQSTFHII